MQVYPCAQCSGTARPAQHVSALGYFRIGATSLRRFTPHPRSLLMQQQVRIINPYAPPAYNGMMNATPEGYVDVDFKIPFDITLTAFQELPNLARDVPTDADFIWRATIANLQTGAYSVQF